MDILLILAAGATDPTIIVQQDQPNSRKRLSEVEITQHLQELSGWELKDQTIYYTHTFNNFVESMNFVNCLVEPAEQLGHHPDLEISYNQVTIRLTTHDVGGLTPLDFELARRITQLLERWKTQPSCP